MGSVDLVVEVELESVLQAAFAARQDVQEFDVHDGDPRLLRSAERTLHGCIVTIQLLLRFVRTQQDPDAERASTPRAFAVMTAEGDVLYINAGMAEVLGRDLRDVVATSLRDRTWVDRAHARRHIDAAVADGVARDRMSFVRGDGRRVAVTVESRRIGSDVPGTLILGLVDAPEDEGPATDDPAAPGPPRPRPAASDSGSDARPGDDGSRPPAAGAPPVA